MSAARVSTEWHHLLSSPALWTDVDVPASVKAALSLTEGDEQSGVNYHERVKKFMNFIGRVDPSVRRFVFVGDIAETVYHDSLRSFVTDARLSELKYVSIDWVKTANSDSDESDSEEQKDCTSLWNVDENHRRRQRYFVHLFEQLCRVALNITSLSLPFDWSSKSVDAITQLRQLEELVLFRYSGLQALECITLDRVVAGLPRLRRLELEVWTPCASGGLTYYSLRSKSLEFVDLSRCRGFAVGHADLPRVRVMKLSRCLWSGPLMVQSTTDVCSLPCLYHVLRDGVPNLEELNGHKLSTGWSEHVSDELESVLKTTCTCELHYGWESITADCF